MNSPQEAAITAADRLGRLRITVRHIEDMWAVVLQRLAYLRGINENRELSAALDQTRAANVHNAIQDILLGDLILQINALVLDRHPRSASMAIAVGELGDGAILDVLRELYRSQASETPRLYNEEDLPPETRDATANHVQRHLANLKLKECDSFPHQLAGIADLTLDSTAADKVRKARNKTVAHYDIVRDGTDWRLWKLRDIGLTYAELLDYIETCTKAIKILARFVGRGSFDFSTASGTAETYIAEYMKALTIGMQYLRHSTPKPVVPQ